jgi:flavin-dependent thymidylate synthase
MKVSLVYYTGYGFADPLLAAKLLIYTKSTRLEQGLETRTAISMMSEQEVMEELQKMAITIRSSWEFVDFVFEIKEVTRAFTHQLVRTRTGSYAQQAQRVVDMTGFGTLLPQTVREAGLATDWEMFMEETSGFYSMLRKADIPAQDARGVLPTNIHTNIIAKFNLRTMADLCAKRDNPRAQGEYTDVVKLMKVEVYKVMPWTKIFLEPERTATPALDAILRRLLGSGSPVDNPELNDAMKELDQLKATWG